MARLSQRFLDFHVEIESFIGYLTIDNQARLGVSDAQYQRLLALLQQWSPVYQNYIKPETRTAPVNASIQSIYKEFSAEIRGLQQQIKKDRSITLTAEDYEKLYIHKDKSTITRPNRPDKAPELVLLNTAHLENEFEAHLPNSEDIRHLALPAGWKLSRKIAVVGPTDPPPLAQDYRPIDSVGRGKFKLTFAPADEGKIGYIICTYFNRRGEYGPESPPLRFHII